MHKICSRNVGFHGQSVTINCYGAGSVDLVDFLFSDLLVEEESVPHAVYDVLFAGSHPMISLWRDDRSLYFGESRYDLAFILLNEVTFQCITDNSAGHAIHAAAVGYWEGAILMPGESGAGKSTLVSWLVANGANYLTDELVILAEETSLLHSFTRPISIKRGSAAVVSSFIPVNEADLLTGLNGFMLPHRQAGSNFIPAATPPLSHILFPRHIPNAPPSITRLSSGLGCSKLLECYVNARNIKGHGISQIANITRKTPVFELTYSSFDGLREIFAETFPALLTEEKSKN